MIKPRVLKVKLINVVVITWRACWQIVVKEHINNISIVKRSRTGEWGFFMMSRDKVEKRVFASLSVIVEDAFETSNSDTTVKTAGIIFSNYHRLFFKASSNSQFTGLMAISFFFSHKSSILLGITIFNLQLHYVAFYTKRTLKVIKINLI